MLVPNADFGSRRETAIVLLGTAEENGFDPRVVKAVEGGFTIPEDLAAILYEEEPKKTSGNRAAKTTKSKED